MSLRTSTFAVRHIREVRQTIDTKDIKMAVAVTNRDLHRLFPVRKLRLARRDHGDGVAEPEGVASVTGPAYL